MDRCLVFTLILAIVGVLFVITGISMQFITNWQVKSRVADVSIGLCNMTYYVTTYRSHILCVLLFKLIDCLTCRFYPVSEGSCNSVW